MKPNLAQVVGSDRWLQNGLLGGSDPGKIHHITSPEKRFSIFHLTFLIGGFKFQVQLNYQTRSDSDGT
ncbi:MAG TPA: hypothetical protein VGJ66_01465 [Pyrinomonadaceae bacterium]